MLTYVISWEQRKVGEWGNFYYGHSCPKWSVTEDATTPCIRYGEMYTKFGCKIDRVYSYTNIPKENLKFSKGTEVLVPRVGEDPMDYNHCTWLSLADVAIGEMISVYNTEQNPLFTAIMFNATLKYEFAKRVEGGSVTNLYYEKLLEIPVSFPNIEEQKKIASLFENLDTLITLHQREYFSFDFGGGSAKNVQKTLSWEQRKLSDTLDFLSNNTLSRAELSEDTGTYKNVHYGDVLIKFGEYIDAQSTDLPYIADDEKAKKFESSKLQDGDIIIADTAEDEAVGKCVEIGNIGDLSIVSGLHTIPCRPKVKFAPAYLGFYLNSASYHDQLIPLMQGIKVTSISKSAISDTMISAPTNLSEQGKIGQFFTRLDSLITLHQHKPNK